MKLLGNSTIVEVNKCYKLGTTGTTGVEIMTLASLESKPFRSSSLILARLTRGRSIAILAVELRSFNNFFLLS